MAAELTKMVQGTPMQRKLKIILGDFIKGAKIMDFLFQIVCLSDMMHCSGP